MTEDHDMVSVSPEQGGTNASWSPSLAVYQRPRKFEDVAGHEAVITFLEHEVRARNGRSVIFFGPTGCGKTTLAEIYANALLCQQENPPCLLCDDCERFARQDHSNLESFQRSELTDQEFAERVNQEVQSEQMGGGRLVVMIEQAEAMSQQCYSTLHGRMERSERVTFILCSRTATVPEKATTDLFRRFTIEGADLPRRFSILSRLCKMEQVKAEVVTRESLARVSSRCVREAIRDWEPLIARRTISKNDVRLFVAEQHPAPIGNYLKALIDGSPRQQMTALKNWDVPDEHKVVAIRGTLSDLFSEDVECLEEDRVRNLAPMLRQAIVARFAQQAGKLGLEVRHLWRIAVTTWAPREGLEQDLLPFILRECHETLNGQGPTLTRGESLAWHSEETNKRAIEKTQPASNHVQSKPRRSKGETPVVDDQEHLSFLEVRKLWNAASFMVQRYSVFLNTRIVIDYGRLGINGTGQINRLHENLREALGKKVERQVGEVFGRQFHWLYVDESVSVGDVRTQWVAHVPTSVLGLVDWLRSEITGLANREITSAAVKIYHGSGDWERHLKLLRCLCRGLGPNIMTETSRSLLDVIGVRRCFRGPIGKRIRTQRIGLSNSINKAEWKKSNEILPPLFAFDRREWGELTSGYEVEEGRHRAKLTELLRAAEQDIDFEYGNGSEPRWLAERESAKQALFDKWRVGAEMREANRPGFKR